ncbi:Protein phosphatase 1 regulatory subunit 12B [Rhizoctonia solani]|uniref:Protein phosphatase 1 regulatory subunit 12B n=1 Tax=Rhizoctonia solani TaxID=456999 RepID=A0A0K6FVD0_9AGAM|nr:Protein phosphatase 1 regulatory subunit 12B [Rhizoctonia solani]
MDRDPSTRLRRAVKENNLFLVRRLVQRTDMRNPDPGPSRFTSLAWAAVLACEEVFEFLLESGHDEEELSRDAENNTILILLAGAPTPAPRYGQPRTHSLAQAHLRMAQLYLDRYAFLLDWPNVQGMSALHQAALKGNEAFVRMLLDLGAFLDQADHQGNTPLHYASAWGHVQVVQLLIERGCQFALRNNEGFTASDYAYSMSTMTTLQDTVRVQFEVNKKQKAARLRNRRASDEDLEDISYGGYPGRFPDAILDPHEPNRLRSGSASTSEGTIESNVASRMRERDADLMAEYRRQGGLETRRVGDEEAEALRRQRSVSGSSLGVPTEASGASGVSGGNLGSTGSQSQISGSGGSGRHMSGSNKALPPPPSVHPFANVSQFSTPTQFPTPLQSQFLPSSNLSGGAFTPSGRNHPIAGEPMPPPPSPGRRLRAVASANALGTMSLAQATRTKRAGTNEGLGTSPGLAQPPAGRNALRSAMSSSRPPPALPPPSGPLPAAPPPTPPPKTGSVGSVGMVRETPKREASGGSGGTSGRETPKKEGKETPSRTGLGLRAGVLGVVKPMLSPSALNSSFFSRGDSSGANSGSARTVEASR